MNRDSTQTPASSQTVGPYFRIGLEYLVEPNRARVPDMRETIEIRGRVLDREGGGCSGRDAGVLECGKNGRVMQRQWGAERFLT